MDIITAGPGCVGLYVHNERDIDPETAQVLVREALAASGLEPWSSTELDIFSGAEGSLILACPARTPRVTIADYALPFLRGF